MLDAYIYDGARTPFGRHAGSLSKVRPDDMLASVIKEVVGRSPFAPEVIDETNFVDDDVVLDRLSRGLPILRPESEIGPPPAAGKRQPRRR